MPTVMQGKLSATGLKVAVVASRFNSFVVEKLVEGALDALVRTGAKDQDLTVMWVPGAFDLPGVARQAVESRKFDAVVCIGAVIRGGTPHFDHVSKAVTSGVEKLSFSSNIPVVFGVLTTDNVEQAIERSGTKAGNKGFDAAMAAIELADLYRQLGGGPQAR
jgi:6,7-dimethyl-8-ribityllumazine synthase